jgi:hypothetical protein
MPALQTGVALSSFLFVNCALVPVLRKPILIGVDAESCFVTDDLANLLSSCNCPSVLMTPPFICAVLAYHSADDLQIAPMIAELIARDSGGSSAEFREAQLIGMCPEYRKVAQFLPIDLSKIHKIAHDFTLDAHQFVAPGELARVDYFLTRRRESTQP